MVDSEDRGGQDIEQSMLQVSTALHPVHNDAEESSMSNNDHVQSNLLIDDRMEDSPFDTATVCSTSLVP